MKTATSSGITCFLLAMAGSIGGCGNEGSLEGPPEPATKTAKAFAEVTANAAGPDYQSVPGVGMVHKSCVHQVPEGAHVFEDGRISVNGQVVSTIPNTPCAYPVISRSPVKPASATAPGEVAAPAGASVSAIAPDTSSPITIVGDGNIMAGYQYVVNPNPSGGNWCNYLTGYYTVPSAPPTLPGVAPLVYLWNGIESVGNASGALAVLQPVLQWGDAVHDTNLQWKMGNWYVVTINGQNQFTQPPLVTVSPGDYIVAYVAANESSTCDIVTGANCSFEVGWMDYTSGVFSSIVYDSSYKFNLILAADLEAIQTLYCNEYPPSPFTIGQVSFSAPGPLVMSNNWILSSLAPVTWWNGGNACNYQVTNQNNGVGGQVTMSWSNTNGAPIVDSGSNQTIALPATATLAGSVKDDKLPNPPGTVTSTWAKVSGSGTVSFANPNALSTTASFSAAGTYVLSLTASDGALSASANVTITVNGVTNKAPVVSAGSNQTITLPATASLKGTATDDGLPNPPGKLTTTWAKVSGPGTVTFANASALSTTASFSVAGTYVLSLTANDGALSTPSNVTITVNGAPKTYEAETLTRTASAVGSEVIQDTNASGGSYVQLKQTPATGAYIEFTIPNLTAATYAVKMMFKSNNNRGINQLSIDGVNQTTTCNEYAGTAKYNVPCAFGNKTLTAGSHKFRFTVTGKDGASSGYTMVIDSIVLTATGN